MEENRAGNEELRALLGRSSGTAIGYRRYLGIFDPRSPHAEKSFAPFQSQRIGWPTRRRRSRGWAPGQQAGSGKAAAGCTQSKGGDFRLEIDDFQLEGRGRRKIHDLQREKPCFRREDRVRCETSIFHW